MGIKFNSGNGAYCCDKCSKMIFDYFPLGFEKEFRKATEASGKFKGVDVWAKPGKKERFCSAKCMKGYFGEDDKLATTVYAD